MERDQFAELCVPLFDKLQKVIEKAFEGCGLPMEEIANVEVLGGSVRIVSAGETAGKVVLEYTGPEKIKFGIELALKDSPLIETVEFL